MKKFTVHVVVSILQAFISLYFKAKTQWNKDMSDLIQETLLCYIGSKPI